MNRNDPIGRVSVVSTGSVQIHPEHIACTWQPTWLWVLTSRRLTAPLPINVYAIEHRNGLVLFDAGLDRASITDPNNFPSGPLLGSLFSMARFEMRADQTLSVLLERIGYRARDVATVVVSHQIEPSPIHDPALAPFDVGHDLFGDGSLVMVPTPEHIAGSISLIVRRPGKPTLALVGDLTYDSFMNLAKGLVIDSKFIANYEGHWLRLKSHLEDDGFLAAWPGAVQ
jgi:N-acyl homoserine lactone hydrolase